MSTGTRTGFFKHRPVTANWPLNTVTGACPEPSLASLDIRLSPRFFEIRGVLGVAAIGMVRSGSVLKVAACVPILKVDAVVDAASFFLAGIVP